jgi:ketosteroid isomerase-like protein
MAWRIDETSRHASPGPPHRGVRFGTGARCQCGLCTGSHHRLHGSPERARRGPYGHFLRDDITAFVPTAEAERVNGKPAVVEIFRQFVETTRKNTSRLELMPEDLEVGTDDKTALVTFKVRCAGLSSSGSRRTVAHRSLPHVQLQAAGLLNNKGGLSGRPGRARDDRGHQPQS